MADEVHVCLFVCSGENVHKELEASMCNKVSAILSSLPSEASCHFGNTFATPEAQSRFKPAHEYFLVTSLNRKCLIIKTETAGFRPQMFTGSKEFLFSISSYDSLMCRERGNNAG